MIAVPADGSAWVTGASSGIGRAMALRLAGAGWRVAASALDDDGLQAVAALPEAAGRIRTFPLDITDGAAVARTVETIEAALAPIALALLNAGVHTPVHADSFSAADFHRLIDVNLGGTIDCFAAILPRMIERRRGQIAITTSLAGRFGLPTTAAYGLTKAGLISMAESLKPELDAHGITLQIVSPGFVRTPMIEPLTHRKPMIIGVEKAAKAFHRGLQRGQFEIVFPRAAAILPNVLRVLPYPLAFAITRRLVKRD
jgi:NAD(P)-dependent dehydrogenase (short-subunit alcohol dehydrogenase family)